MFVHFIIMKQLEMFKLSKNSSEAEFSLPYNYGNIQFHRTTRFSIRVGEWTVKLRRMFPECFSTSITLRFNNLEMTMT